MASHRRLVKHFSRKSGPRKALIRGLMNSLVEHGRIKTTVTRAKEVRRHIEKAVTLGKKDNLNSIRLLISRLASQDAALAIVKDIAPRFKERDGGYTRVIKIGRRPGDTAEMAFLEFVDYDFKTAKAAAPAAKATKAAKGAKADKTAEKAASKAKKASSVAVKTAKKSVRKMQNKSRQASQAAAR
ncbi:50S ribosomal protein L17 [Bdellovibrio sp. qaytius]|nr:50S ribosomal protein L17 [Bdellovibrio sp. qaytius]